MIAAYSMGALVLRYVLPKLPSHVRAQVVHIDLLGDPTADRKVDIALQHPRGLGGRLTDGMDTWSGRAVHLGRFKQTAYPADAARKTFQYCLPYDYVCDFNPVSVASARRKAHEHYDWQAIGRTGANGLRSWSGQTP